MSRDAETCNPGANSTLDQIYSKVILYFLGLSTKLLEHASDEQVRVCGDFRRERELVKVQGLVCEVSGSGFTSKGLQFTAQSLQ